MFGKFTARVLQETKLDTFVSVFNTSAGTLVRCHGDSDGNLLDDSGKLISLNDIIEFLGTDNFRLVCCYPRQVARKQCHSAVGNWETKSLISLYRERSSGAITLVVKETNIR